jgi:hypothetical protein
MKKYSLIWWFSFGKIDKEAGNKRFKHISKKIAKLVYNLGYMVA